MNSFSGYFRFIEPYEHGGGNGRLYDGHDRGGIALNDRSVNKRWNMPEYAYHNVPLYRDRLRKMGTVWQELADRSEWDRLPVIEKNQIVEHADDLVSEEFVVDVALERLIHTHTSGSTGTFLDVYWNKEDMLHALLPLWVDRWKAAGIHARDSLCQFNTTLAN